MKSIATIDRNLPRYDVLICVYLLFACIFVVIYIVTGVRSETVNLSRAVYELVQFMSSSCCVLRLRVLF